MTVDLTRLVKPLVWVPTRVRRKHLVEGEEVIELRAKGPFLYTLSKNYQIGFSWSAFWGRNSPIDNGICVTLAAAQAAANADYAARVLASIDTALVKELVEAAARVAADVADLAAHSEGVAGLHMNGDLAPWESLLDGGEFGTWLGSVAELEEVIAKMKEGA